MRPSSGNQPLASLSLDLDNQWSYMKTHGDPGWESFPTYLDRVVPRFLTVLARLDVKITVFVVGQDAALDKNHAALAQITAAGHELGNHSFHHEPWLHRYSRAELDRELERAEAAIVEASGAMPIGFRGPGYSVSQETLEALFARGYQYDASTLPTYIGPLARAYYFLSTSLSDEQLQQREQLFGRFHDGMRPVSPYRWQLSQGTLLEIPVTTLPILKVPIHLSYVIYLSTFAPRVAQSYFRNALRICRLAGVEPSILLHPLDFLGSDDLRELAFFPGMNLPHAVKIDRVEAYLRDLTERFDVVPMRDHASAILARSDVPRRRPDFPAELTHPRATEPLENADAEHAIS